MDTLAKIYDKIILNRLTQWASIDKCQAGAQKGRGCIEQIMCLRLLVDIVKSVCCFTCAFCKSLQ